jgi:hypothetical protein
MCLVPFKKYTNWQGFRTITIRIKEGFVIIGTGGGGFCLIHWKVSFFVLNRVLKVAVIRRKIISRIIINLFVRVIILKMRSGNAGSFFFRRCLSFFVLCGGLAGLARSGIPATADDNKGSSLSLEDAFRNTP